VVIGFALVNKQGFFVTGVLRAASTAAGLISPADAATWQIVLNCCYLMYTLSANGKESLKMIQDPCNQPEIGMKAV